MIFLVGSLKLNSTYLPVDTLLKIIFTTESPPPKSKILDQVLRLSHLTQIAKDISPPYISEYLNLVQDYPLKTKALSVTGPVVFVIVPVVV